MEKAVRWIRVTLGVGLLQHIICYQMKPLLEWQPCVVFMHGWQQQWERLAYGCVPSCTPPRIDKHHMSNLHA